MAASKMLPKRLRKLLDDAVRISRFRKTALSYRDDTRLYKKWLALCGKVSDATGVPLEDVCDQVGQEANKLGPMTPMLGKDL